MAKIRISETEHSYRITLADPPLNILDIEMMEELLEVLQKIGSDHPILVIDSEGDKVFSAGASVQDHLGDRIETMLDVFHECCRQIHRMGLITVALVDAPALGGGCELALCCDIVLASDRAKFGQPEIHLGVYPPVAAYQLSRQIAPRIGLEMLVTGEPIDAKRAHELGLINAVFPAEVFEQNCESWLERIHRHSSSSLWFTKRAFRLASTDEFDASLAETERLYLEELMETEDATEGLNAFIEKRKPEWKGR